MPLLRTLVSFPSRPVSQSVCIYTPAIPTIIQGAASYATTVGHGHGNENGNGLRGRNLKGVPSLKQFILRARVLGFYRDILRTLKSTSQTNPTLKTELKTYARGEFERNKFVEEEAHVRYLLSIGEREFEQMKRYILGG